MEDVYPHEDVSWKTPGEGQTVLDAIYSRTQELLSPPPPKSPPPIDSSLKGLPDIFGLE